MSASGPESVTGKFIHWADNMDGLEMVVDCVGVIIHVYHRRVACVAASTTEGEQPCSKTEARLRTQVEDNLCKVSSPSLSLPARLNVLPSS